MIMKIVKLYAYLHNNVGDDLMVSILLKRYPHILFYYEDYMNPNKDKQFLKYGNFCNLGFIYKKYGRLNHLFNILTNNKKMDGLINWVITRLNKRCLCSVYIGGSLFMQNTGVTAEKEKKKLSNGPLFIIGANFGPYSDNSFFENFYVFFKQCQAVCFRDQNSFLLFHDIPQVYYAPDVVFNLPMKNMRPNGRRVLISVIDFSKRADLRDYEEQYLSLIRSLCGESIRRGMIPVLTSFCQYEGDENAINRVLIQLDESVKSKTECFFYHELDDVDIMLKDVGFIVATRFHAMILAVNNRIPFYCIAYNNKLTNVLKEIDCNSYCLPNSLTKVNVQEVFNFQYSFEKTKAYTDLAEAQFKAFDEFLDSGLTQTYNKSKGE